MHQLRLIQSIWPIWFLTTVITSFLRIAGWETNIVYCLFTVSPTDIIHLEAKSVVKTLAHAKISTTSELDDISVCKHASISKNNSTYQSKGESDDKESANVVRYTS